MSKRRYPILIAFAFLGLLLAGTGGEARASDAACLPCIDLIKTGPASAAPGDTITYGFTVKNCGNVLLGSGAYVYDELIFQGGPIWYGNIVPGEIVTFYRDYTIPQNFCGSLVNNATALGVPDETVSACFGVPNVTDADNHTVVVSCDSGSPGTGTPGYWKNHPEAWPVNSIAM